jgi:hypothetical protein
MSSESISSYDSQYDQYINGLYKISDLGEWSWTTPPTFPALIYGDLIGVSPESLYIGKKSDVTYALLTNVMVRTSFDISGTEPIHLLLIGMVLVGVGCTLRRNIKIKGNQKSFKVCSEIGFFKNSVCVSVNNPDLSVSVPLVN